MSEHTTRKRVIDWGGGKNGGEKKRGPRILRGGGREGLRECPIPATPSRPKGDKPTATRSLVVPRRNGKEGEKKIFRDIICHSSGTVGD